MPRARVTAATLRKLDAIEQRLHGTDTGPVPGVMLAPAMLSLDEWEHAAQASQVELVRATRADLDREHAPVIEHLRTLADPHDVTAAYKPRPPPLPPAALPPTDQRGRLVHDTTR